MVNHFGFSKLEEYVSPRFEKACTRRDTLAVLVGCDDEKLLTWIQVLRLSSFCFLPARKNVAKLEGILKPGLYKVSDR